MKKISIKTIFVLLLALTAGTFTSCESDELHDPSFENADNELLLSVTEDSLQLQETFLDNSLSFNWTSGTNQGTGAAIAYTLEIDLAANDLSDPLLRLLEDQKNIFSTSIDHGTLNQRLLEAGLEPGNTYELQARLTAEVADASVASQTSVLNFNVELFKPVSSRLFILGDATPNGWDISNATALEASTEQRGVFTYTGPLTEGNFKFAVNQDSCFCQDFYTQHPEDANMIVYNDGGSGEDLQWTVEEAGNYKVTVDLLNKTLSMESVEDSKFSNLYIVGSATESGWNIDTPVAFEQSAEDPFVFTYEGNFAPGDFKILAGATGDWCGQWYRPMTAGQPITDNAAELNSGCEVDNNWTITEETAGRYQVTVNTANNTVRFNKINLYIIGDGGPNGWNIATPEPMAYENGDFVFRGPLGADNPTGEFKFSKYQGDWCDAGWIVSATNGQSIDNTDFTTAWGCDGPDNKWKLKDGEAGEYEIRINLDTETMSITRL